MLNKPDENLGIAGRLRRVCIAWVLTPLFILAALAAGMVARFLVGTNTDDAILRGMDDVASLTLTLTLTLSGRGASANDLTRLARAVQTEVAKADNIGLSYLVGKAHESIRIAPDPERLALYSMTLQQLAGKVAQANRTLNTGRLRNRGAQVDLVAGQTLTASS